MFDPLKCDILHSKPGGLLYSVSFTASIIMNSWTLITSLILLMLTILLSLRLISSKQTVSSNHLMPLLLQWAQSYRVSEQKLQNVGADDRPLTILIDGVPAERVDEFVYLGSKQSSNGHCRPDVFYA